MNSNSPTRESLAGRWEALYKAKSSSKAIRLTATCVPDLFIGLDERLNRIFILYSSASHDSQIIPVTKANLSLEFVQNQLIIRLESNFFADLFDDLILSIYFKITNSADEKEYVREFITAFHKWSAFFQNISGDRLSEATIIGLYGELVFLKHIIRKEGKPTNINEILSSWRGPYDISHDFVLNDSDVEVKTLLLPNIDVRISSEFQLAAEFEKPLRLAVAEVEKDYLNGNSLAAVVADVHREIIERGGDFLIMAETLHQKGLTAANLRDYDNFRFRLHRIIVFDCTDERFPKITREQIHPAISKVKYNLRLSGIAEFMIEEILS